MSKKYYIDLAYGCEVTDEGAFHGFIARDPSANPDDTKDSMEISSWLDIDVDDPDYEFNSQDIEIPQSLIDAIQKDGVIEARNEGTIAGMVYVCSPFAGDVEKNTENARKYCRYVLNKMKMPLAPHLHYPQFMDDNNPAERTLALSFGLRFIDFCSELWVFGPEISAGMKMEIEYAERIGKPVKYVSKEEAL